MLKPQDQCQLSTLEFEMASISRDHSYFCADQSTYDGFMSVGSTHLVRTSSSLDSPSVNIHLYRRFSLDRLLELSVIST